MVRQKKKFEIACYPGKVVDFRKKRETNLDEVLQAEGIFSDVESGKFASKAELKQAFKNMSTDEIIIEILNKGEFQESEAERGDALDKVTQEIASIIVKMTVNSEDGNKFPVSIILKAISQTKSKINGSKAAKPQALQIINQLKDLLPIERDKMFLKVSFKTLEQAEML